MSNNLDVLVDAANAALAAVRDELMKAYPPGTPVKFKISAKQKTPSTGVVTFLDHGIGNLRVIHNEAKPGSRYARRTVHYSDLIA